MTYWTFDTLAPAESWGHHLQNGFQHMRIVGNTELVRNGEQQRVRLSNCLVLLKLLNEHVRFSGITTAEDGSGLCVEEADAVLFLVSSSEVSAVEIIYQC